VADKDFVVKNGLVVANGNISVTGTVDGRDVATDGTKLDGIESGATADQTASEILTAIKTVDGAASGLDADLLDGQQGSYYLDWTNTTNKPDPVITLAGDLSGSVTLTDLTSGTLTATVGTLNQNTSGSAATLTTARAIQVSGAVTGTANFDGSAAINIVTTHTADPVITLTGAVTGSGTMTNLGSVSIATTATADPTLTLAGDATGSATFTNLGNATLTVTVADDSHNHIISNVDGLQTALDAKLALAGGTMTGNLIFGDNVKATFGAGSDLQIYHDGLNSFIDEVGTGRLYIRASDGIYMSSPSNALYLSTFDTGDLSLYHNGNAKLTTTATGIDVTGTVTATTSGIIPTIFGGTGATQTLTLQNTNGNANNAKILIGNIVSSDNGGISLFSAGTSASTLRMRVSGTSGDISFYEDTGTTPQMIWDASADALTFGDNVKATFGAGSDLQIYHDGLNSYIADTATGSLHIKGTSLFLEDADGNEFIRMSDQGSGGIVYLKNLGATKLATTATGIDVTGTATADAFSGPLTGNVTGNASTATTLQTPITINGVSFNGSANITVTATATNALTIGSYLTGSSYNGSSAITIAADATSSNTASKLVARDASGNFSAGAITASGLTIGAITLPATDGTNGQVLTTDGSGNVTFADAGGGGSSSFLGLGDTPSSYSGASNQLVGVNAAENALGFVDEIEISEFVLSAVTAPTTPAADSMAMYVTASGTTPNREVSYKMKNELGQEIIISSILV
jgi:hypothetical protein